MDAKQVKRLAKSLEGIVLHGELLSRHTTFGIGGPATAYVTPANRLDLAAVLRFAHQADCPIYFLGSGSNLLASDQGFDGIVVTLAKALNRLEIKDRYVTAEGGVMLGHLVRRCLALRLTGMESLIGVPGTLGGALIMNAGAFGGEISKFLRRVVVLTASGAEKIYDRSELQFSYRQSSFPAGEIIVAAEFEFDHGSQAEMAALKATASGERKARQPLRHRSAGSVFKNPAPDQAAGALIDRAGLKGTRRGAAEISTKHANFFINHGQATAEEVAYLIKLAARTVRQLFHVQLQLEIRTLGFPPGYWQEAGVA